MGSGKAARSVVRFINDSRTMSLRVALAHQRAVQVAMARARSRLASSRGDVPGWVLVTVMTAGLVTALWLIADTQFRAVFTRALAAVNAR